jgi:hypothetical protein
VTSVMHLFQILEEALSKVSLFADRVE